ncbi:hypothetical protein HOP52_10890 [Halomonas campisalis]|uniref:PPM-type phosphatase domain-containing protein n=1 Tax=Billgrantia campisalis TaxID=74661 RepID=A0ABS9PAU7_9GAMM|nr:protein phosphatase 2C domain-containing protein [Halomonas campisalis]MCG6658260.1 hypothetical protein [Halomonas campisalis]MDR5862929.1 protein phosphatase 2C domain-containing protein [Halomonas campisalis]
MLDEWRQALPGPEATGGEHEMPSRWQVLAAAVAGLGHLEAKPPVPCQDAAGAVDGPRTVLAVADGAGSSPASDRGARAVVGATLRLVETLDGQLVELLDTAAEPAGEALRQFALLLVKHAKGVLHDLAGEHCRPVRDLRCTLSVLILGRERLLWLKVGDGAIVVERAVTVDSTADEPAGPQLAPQLTTLGKPGKGEFANQTLFIDEGLSPEQVQSGSQALDRVTGAAVMSDGAAEKLVASDGGRVSGQLSHWFDDLRGGRLRQRDLVRLFYGEAFCRGTTGDDRGIALASRSLEALLAES